MILGITFRLLAVVFARGWGMIDDHFLAIEAPQSWADGFIIMAGFPEARVIQVRLVTISFIPGCISYSLCF